MSCLVSAVVNKTDEAEPPRYSLIHLPALRQSQLLINLSFLSRVFWNFLHWDFLGGD